MKRAESIVFDKPGKADADTTTSYRLIVFLETLSKIVNRLIANCLSAQARELGLIDNNHCGLVAGMSAFCTVASLNHGVVIALKLRLKASTLFLDIKGCFDNVRQATLTGYLQEKGVSPYIVAWVRSFLSDRSCRLPFQRPLREFSEEAVGTPKGSLISPLLFVLHVAPLFRSQHTENTFSFVDDFALTSMATSYRRNVQMLQARFKALSRKANRHGLIFSIPKTELIYRQSPKDRSRRCLIPVTLNS